MPGVTETLFTVLLAAFLVIPLAGIPVLSAYKLFASSKKIGGLRLGLTIVLFTISLVALVVFKARLVEVLLPLIFAMVILYPMLFLGGTVKERIVLGLANYVILSFSGLFSLVIMAPELAKLPLLPVPSLLLVCALTVTIYVVSALFLIHVLTEGRRCMPRQYWVGAVIVFSFLGLGAPFLINSGILLSEIDNSFLPTNMLSLGVLIVWVLLYFCFYFLCQYFSKAAEAQALAIQNDLIERYLLRKQASDERIKELSHDLRHSLAQWRTLAEEKGNATALQSIAECEKQLQSSVLIDVENEAANALINQKSWEANQLSIEFLVEGAFHQDLLVSTLDLCSLLGNLLDNALEAAAPVETKSLRRVKLSLKRKGNLLIVMVENGYAKTPVLKNGVLVSSKNDKEFHSLGIRSIQRIADAYEGVANYSFKDGCFKATVMLCGYATVLSGKN